jgi:hypothetical protein
LVWAVEVEFMLELVRAWIVDGSGLRPNPGRLVMFATTARQPGMEFQPISLMQSAQKIFNDNTVIEEYIREPGTL